MKWGLVWLGLALLRAVSAQNTVAPAQNSAPAAQNAAPPKAPAADAYGAQTFDLKYVDPERVRDLFSGRSFVMEANRDLKCLTATGPPAFLKEVEDAVKRFDIPPPPPPIPANINITVYLLTVAALAPSAGPLPTELTAINKEVTPVGSPPLRLADSQMMRIREGDPGEATGSQDVPDAAKLVRIKVQSASVTPGPKGDTISLNGLKVWLSIPQATLGEAAQAKTDSDLTADIDIGQNQTVVVSKAGVDKPEVVIVRASVIR